MSRLCTLLTALALGLLAAVLPTSAQAATQEYAALLEDGRLTRFTAESASSLTRPVAVRGLQARETLLALGSRDRVLFGLGSAARLYRVDARTGQATPVAGGRALAQGLRGRRFSLVVSPDGARMRILSDVGQDLTVDLATGEETPGPGLRTADGTPVAPVVASTRDGRLLGVDLARRIRVLETAPGSSVVEVTRLRDERIPPDLRDPTAYVVDPDGREQLLADLGTRRTQSFFMSVLPAEGLLTTRQQTGYFLRQLLAVAPLGTVASDRTPARATIRVPRTISVRRLIATNSYPVDVRLQDAAQVFVYISTRGQRTGSSLRSFDVPTRLRPVGTFFDARDRRILRGAVGRRVNVVITLNDHRRNSRTIVRPTRLVR